ncbi:hypothetical protein AB3S75_014191 [Citrus x aurantiifolia]
MQRLNICAKIIDVFLMFEADMMEGFRCEQSLLSSILNQSDEGALSTLVKTGPSLKRAGISGICFLRVKCKLCSLGCVWTVGSNYIK